MDAKDHYRRAISLEKRGRISEALRECDLSISLDPWEPRYHAKRAQLLKKLKRFEEALGEYDKAIRLDPINSRYHASKASILRSMKRYLDALREYDKALSLEYGNPRYIESREKIREELRSLGLNPSRLTSISTTNALIASLKERKVRKAKVLVGILESLGVSVTSLACELSSKGECRALLWIMENYQVNYQRCQDLRGFVDCIMSSRVLPRGVDDLLLALARDREYGKRLAGLALATAKDRGTRELAERLLTGNIEGVRLPPLDSWDPNLWLNREIYGYHAVKFLGKGGTSYVLLVEREGVKYAMKIPALSPSNKGETKVSQSTFSELASESSKLQEISRNADDLVKLYGIFSDLTTIRQILSGKVDLYLRTPPALIMEYMAGGDAESLLSREALFYSQRWEKIVTLILHRVARALNSIHSEGLVHLDVKTRNVFFTSDPGESGEEVLRNLKEQKVKVKLGDLGASRKLGTPVDQYTPEYCPPDQVKALLRRGGATKEMDVFALGATGYKMFTRRSLIPPEIVEMYEKAIEGDGEMIVKAERSYREMYLSLRIENAGPEMERLLKLMVHPDPGVRPSATQVAITLFKMSKAFSQ
ncbi:protein kinase domain-containing protein [Metallosphaera hakonensis]|nr:tetratricopeptide repeat protein [Metallosphaera hakonensis]